MNRRDFLGGTGAVTLSGLAGCMGSDDDPVTDIDEEDISQTIVLDSREYDPIRSSIDAGEGVEWRNDDDRTYTVISSSRGRNMEEWDFEAEIEPGESASFLFEDQGIYGFNDYDLSTFSMCGAIAVGPSDEDDIGQLDCEL